MARYIDAEKLIEERTMFMQDEEGFDISVVLVEDVKLAPTADVAEVKHGEWLYDGEDWFCTRCNRNALCDKMTGEEVLSIVCPHCGAKMDGKKDLQ